MRALRTDRLPALLVRVAGSIKLPTEVACDSDPSHAAVPKTTPVVSPEPRPVWTVGRATTWLQRADSFVHATGLGDAKTPSLPAQRMARQVRLPPLKGDCPLNCYGHGKDTAPVVPLRNRVVSRSRATDRIENRQAASGQKQSVAS